VNVVYVKYNVKREMIVRAGYPGKGLTVMDYINH